MVTFAVNKVHVMNRFCLGIALLWALVASSQAQVTSDGEQARRLLQSAVEYYRMQGDAALAAFSWQGEFIDGQHYVFVVDTQGTMLASGGSSAVLIGRDVSTLLEPELRTAFARALASEEGRVESAEYRWMNVRDGRVEDKYALLRKVGHHLVAVGYYREP
jgi:hypothetical protein